MNEITISSGDTYDSSKFPKDQVLFTVKVIPIEKYNTLKNTSNSYVKYFVGENEKEVLQITFSQDALKFNEETTDNSGLLKINQEDILSRFTFPKQQIQNVDEDNSGIKDNNSKVDADSSLFKYLDFNNVKPGDVIARIIVKSVIEDEDTKTVNFRGSFNLYGILTVNKNSPIDDTKINGLYMTMSFSNYRYIYNKKDDTYKVLAHFDQIISTDE